MKARVLILSAIGLAVVGGLFYATRSRPQSQRISAQPVESKAEVSRNEVVAKPSETHENAPLMVDDLRAKADQGKDTISVLGVVGGRNAERSIFGLIDKREVEECGTVSCPEFLLPVHWSGDMPRMREIVVVSGTLAQSSTGLVLVAEKVERK